MNAIYLDTQINSKKIISGTINSGNAVYGVYDPTNINDSCIIASSGMQFTINGVILRYITTSLQIGLFTSEFFPSYKLQVGQTDGSFMDASDDRYCPVNVTLPVCADHYRYNNPDLVNGTPTNPLFATKESNPFNVDGSLKTGLVDEIKFFRSNLGCAANNIPMGLYSLFISAIHEYITENYPSAT